MDNPFILSVALALGITLATRIFMGIVATTVKIAVIEVIKELAQVIAEESNKEESENG